MQLGLHAARLRGQRFETNALPPFVDSEGIFDRPWRDRAVTSRDELRSEHLRPPFGHAHAVQQTREVRGISVAAIDRSLEVLERASLKISVGELGDEPRGVLAVVTHELATGPCFVVVEDGPEAFGTDRISGVLGEREQLRTQGLVAGHQL